MCYRCATNPSIHHHRCHIVAVSSLLSHHGVTFAVALSQFHCCHCSVAFMLVVVSLSPLPCRLHVGCGFIIAIMVLPLLLHHHGVIVAVILLWCLHCRIVV